MPDKSKLKIASASPAALQQEKTVVFSKSITLSAKATIDIDPNSLRQSGNSLIYKDIKIEFNDGQKLNGTYNLPNNTFFVSDPVNQITNLPEIRELKTEDYKIKDLTFNYDDIKQFISSGGKSTKQNKTRKRKFNNLRKYSKKR